MKSFMNKQLPASIEAEQELLGEILNNRKRFIEVVEKLKPQDFYIEKHQEIFKIMCGLFAEGKEIGLVTLAESLGKENLEKIGGISYITSLIETRVPISISAYIKLLKDKSKRRNAIKTLVNGLGDLYDDKKETSAIIGHVQNEITDFEGEKNKILTDEELFSKTMESIELHYQNGGEIPGMKTGFIDFDRATNGLKKGEFTVIGGRPSMGKTLIALNIADGLAKNGYKVGLVELEMTPEALGIRRLAYNANVQSSKLQTGRLTDQEFIKISETYNYLSKQGKIFTDCSDYQSILTIKAKAKAIKESKGLDVLIVDHLGLMDIKDRENRSYAIGEVTRQLKLLAKELDINVILICQLSRAVEQRADKRPMLSDLRESGNIEQDADLVVFAYRDEYYNKETEEKNIMEWIIAKQRNGRTGTLKFAYLSELQKIGNLDKIYQ